MFVRWCDALAVPRVPLPATDGTVAMYLQSVANSARTFAPVKAAFEANFDGVQENGASFCMTLEGKPVVDIWAGFADEAQTKPWEKDTIVNVYSTTKTMTALTALSWRCLSTAS